MGPSTPPGPLTQHTRLSTRVLHPPRKAPGLGGDQLGRFHFLPCWRGAGGKDGRTERSEIQPDHEQGELGHLYLYMRRWWLLVQDSHEEKQFPKGTTMAATEPRLVLDNVADIFQLLVAQLAFLKPGKKMTADTA